MMNITPDQWARLARFVPEHQLKMVQEFTELQSLMPDLLEQIGNTPALYAQDGLGDQTVIHLHYFYAGSDWYISEVDRDSLEAFGYVCLNGDKTNGEWGYISIEELLSLANKYPIELDFHWIPKELSKCK